MVKLTDRGLSKLDFLQMWFTWKCPLLANDLNIISKKLINILSLKGNRESSQQGWIWKDLQHADDAKINNKQA